MRIMYVLRNAVFLTALSIGMLFAGCGSNKTAKKNPEVNMNVYSSYAFLPNKDTIKTSDYNNRWINERVIEEISDKMKDLDYRLDREQPDLLIYYHLMMDEATIVNATPVYTNYSYYKPGYYVGPYYKEVAYNNYFTIQRLSGENINQVDYREGTLVIDFIDGKTNEIIWRGTAKDVISAGDLETEIKTYVAGIFENFPN